MLVNEILRGTARPVTRGGVGVMIGSAEPGEWLTVRCPLRGCGCEGSAREGEAPEEEERGESEVTARTCVKVKFIIYTNLC